MTTWYIDPYLENNNRFFIKKTVGESIVSIGPSKYGLHQILLTLVDTLENGDIVITPEGTNYVSGLNRKRLP